MFTTKLTPFLPLLEYYKAHKTVPPINMPILEALAAIYREEINPATVRLYCSVCVHDMITTLFNRYEREREEKEKRQDEPVFIIRNL
jgi:hypothetical protein